MLTLYGTKGSGSAAIEAALAIAGAAHLAAARPEFSALLARVEAEPRVARVFARHWPAS
jgi:hypothetical protein